MPPSYKENKIVSTPDVPDEEVPKVSLLTRRLAEQVETLDKTILSLYAKISPVICNTTLERLASETTKDRATDAQLSPLAKDIEYCVIRLEKIEEMISKVTRSVQL